MAPPMLPHMFMAPETVPAHGPPISIAAAQEQGMERSAAKLETPIARTASSGDSMYVESSRNQAPAMNPMDAPVRRPLTVLPLRRARRAAAKCPARLPRPPKNNGRTASHLAESSGRGGAARKKPGSHVVQKKPSM